MGVLRALAWMDAAGCGWKRLAASLCVGEHAVAEVMGACLYSGHDGPAGGKRRGGCPAWAIRCYS